MPDTKEIAIYKPNMSITELRQLAMDFAKSGYFADAKEAVQAVVKIQAGIELGFGPVYSMTKIYIVKGKVTVSAEALGALVKRSGRYDYTVNKLTDTECELQFTDNSKPVYNSRFTMEDAKRADLLKQDSGWLKYPRAMLVSKALSQGARIVCPHVISGVYTPEDFGIETDSAGEVIEGMATEVKEVETVTASTTESSTLEELATPAQIKKLFTTGGKMGYTDDAMREILARHYHKEHTKDLTKKEASEFIEKVEAGAHINESGEWE